MSKAHTVKLVCKECGQEFDFVVHESVNVTLNPELREEVITGRMQETECPHCGAYCKVIYPFLYHDMEHNFMIQLDTYPGLLSFKAMLEGENNPFKCFSKKYKFIGATNLADLSSIVIAIENGLDWRVTKLVLLYTKYYVLEQGLDDKKVDKIEWIALSESIEGEKFGISIGACIDGKQNVFSGPFDYALYESLLKESHDKLDKFNPFIFEEDVCKRFAGEMMNKKEINEQKEKFFIVRDSLDQLYVCDALGFLKDQLQEGEPIIFTTKYGDNNGIVERIITINPIEFIVDEKYFGVIDAFYNDIHILTDKISSDSFEQDDSINALLKFKEDNYGETTEEPPIQELLNLKVILGVCSKPQNDFVGLCEIREKDSGTIEHVQNVARDGRLYLAVYSDPLYLPDKEECESGTVAPFMSIARIIKNDSRYDGIIINQHDQDIMFNRIMLSTFVTYGYLLSKEKTKKLLDNLNEHEIKYLGYPFYDICKELHDNDISLKDLEPKYHLTHKEYENNKAKEDKKMEDVRHIEAIIAKQRNGRTGIAHLFFFRQYSKYEVPSKDWEEQYAKINVEVS